MLYLIASAFILFGVAAWNRRSNHATFQIIIFCIALTLAHQCVNAGELFSNIKIYGHYVGEDGVVYYVNSKAVSLPKGVEAIMEFSGIHAEERLPVDLIDIETIFKKPNEYSREAVIATLEVYTRTVPFIYRHDVPREYILDIQQMQDNAIWEKNALYYVKAHHMQEDKSYTTILFRNINLREILNRYTANKIWPTEIMFKVIIHINHKLAGSISKNLTIPIPPY